MDGREPRQQSLPVVLPVRPAFLLPKATIITARHAVIMPWIRRRYQPKWATLMVAERGGSGCEEIGGLALRANGSLAIEQHLRSLRFGPHCRMRDIVHAGLERSEESRQVTSAASTNERLVKQALASNNMHDMH